MKHKINVKVDTFTVINLSQTYLADVSPLASCIEFNEKKNHQSCVCCSDSQELKSSHVSKSQLHSPSACHACTNICKRYILYWVMFILFIIPNSVSNYHLASIINKAEEQFQGFSYRDISSVLVFRIFYPDFQCIKRCTLLM